LYSAYSSQILSTRKRFCNSTSDDQIVYSNYKLEFCRFNCFVDLSVKHHKCIIRYKAFIDVIEHLINKNYKICPKINNNSDSAKQYTLFCDSFCGQECNSINYDINVKSHKSFNSTKLNLIPISSNHLRYTETLKTDINGLIFNLGGVIGLWFGISPLSIVHLISLLIKLFRKTKQLMTSIINSFKLLIKRFVLKTKSIFIFCINRLIGYFKRMIQILLNLLCIHCLNLFDA